MSDTKKEVKEALKGILMAILLYFVIQVSLVAATGVDNPISVVISGSMDHRGYDFDDWWMYKGTEYAPYDIDKQDFASFPYQNGFARGDILIVSDIDPKEIDVGDVIVFDRGNDSIPIVHRVIDIYQNNGERYFLTKGDYNQIPDNYYCGGIHGICEEDVIGKVTTVVPKVGNITLWIRGVFGYNA
ncbi:signal peptidase I [archaeon]|nr:MAG: signal peptidase I [archaeon]